MNTYFALVHKEPDSCFGITFPDLPGCFSAADTEDDLLIEAQRALTLYVSDLDELPKSRPITELLEDPLINSEIAEGAFFIAIPVIIMSRKARFNLMIDTDLVAGIDRMAKAIGMNRSEFVSEAVAARLGEQTGAVINPARRPSSKKNASKDAKSVAASALTQKVSRSASQNKKGRRRFPAAS
jgi:predicted RNase H-like HicB family nuclease